MPLGIHHEVLGSGQPIVLLAGLTQDVTQWGILAEDLPSQFSVILHDPRGAGRTMAGFEGLTVSDMACDALALMDQLGIERAHILGFSLGGMTAQVLAALHPERVDRLVLVSTASRIGVVPMAAIRAARTLFAASQCAVYANETLMPWLVGEKALMEGSIARGFATRTYRPSLEGFTAQCEALAAFEGAHLLPRITARTLCLGGEEDLLLPPRHGCEMAAAIPGATYRELPGCGHMCFLEDPEAFMSTVLPFLKGE